jgi:hypothetical protein
MRRGNKRRRGAAMAEAAIMVPVFGVLLIGTLFVGRMHLRAPSARAEARSCALRHALAGCREPPSGCEAVLGAARRTPSAASERLWQGASDNPDPQLSLERLPQLKDAIDDLFGQTTSAEVPWELAVPGDPSGATTRGSGRYSLLCVQPPSSANLAEATLGVLREIVD